MVVFDVAQTSEFPSKLLELNHDGHRVYMVTAPEQTRVSESARNKHSCGGSWCRSPGKMCVCKGAVRFTNWWGPTVSHGRCLHFSNRTSTWERECEEKKRESEVWSVIMREQEVQNTETWLGSWSWLTKKLRVLLLLKHAFSCHFRLLEH